jgi:flagellar biosynthesis protein FlhB
MDDVERTLPATPRRRDWAREQGYSARSAALTAAASLMTAAALWMWSGPAVIDQLASRLQSRLSRPAADSTVRKEAADLIRDDLLALGFFGLWGMCAVWGAAAVANLLQTGLQWSPAAIAAKPGRFSPASGLSGLGSGSSVLTSFWSMLVLGGVSAGALVALSWWKPWRSLWGAPFQALVRQVNNDLASTALRLAGLLAALCLVDVARRRWALERSLQMTAGELREEAGKTPMTRRRPLSGR